MPTVQHDRLTIEQIPRGDRRSGNYATLAEDVVLSIQLTTQDERPELSLALLDLRTMRAMATTSSFILNEISRAKILDYGEEAFLDALGVRFRLPADAARAIAEDFQIALDEVRE